MYLYELPTTGFVSFSEICALRNQKYANNLSEATQVRANVRNAMKEGKRADYVDKDYLGLLKALDEYIPQLQAVLDCVAHDEFGLKGEPVFSWRATLSTNLFNASPRHDFPGLFADWVFTLLTYAFTLSNYARSVVKSLGSYEHVQSISDIELKSSDERLNFSVDLLRRSSGIFTYVAETALLEWERSQQGTLIGIPRPFELSRDVNTALSKVALASAQTLAIRKLLTKAIYDNNISPGPPLPKSHPAPGLISKLHLECVQLHTSALALLKGTPKGSEMKSGEVVTSLRHYLADEILLHSALAHKWLGVEAGEKGGSERAGEAVGFMAWAKRELEDLKGANKLSALRKPDKEKDGSASKKAQITSELASVEIFLKYYKRMNDSIHFRPVPSQQELQGKIPTGRLAVSPVAFAPPPAAFGPGSVGRVDEEVAALNLGSEGDAVGDTASYAGSGSYY